MRKLFNTNKKYHINLGDNKVTIEKASSKGVLLSIKGRAIGFETVVLLKPQDVRTMSKFIRDNVVIRRDDIITNEIDYVHAKQCEYTRRNDEKEATYKFYESNRCTLHMLAFGDSIVMNLYSEEKQFVTVMFRPSEMFEKLPEINEAINKMLKDSITEDWDM
jgi:hypothetical protein